MERHVFSRWCGTASCTCAACNITAVAGSASCTPNGLFYPRTALHGFSRCRDANRRLPPIVLPPTLPQFEEMYEQRRREVNKEFEKYQKQLKAAKKSGSKAAADKVILAVVAVHVLEAYWPAKLNGSRRPGSPAAMPAKQHRARRLAMRAAAGDASLGVLDAGLEGGHTSRPHTSIVRGAANPNSSSNPCPLPTFCFDRWRRVPSRRQSRRPRPRAATRRRQRQAKRRGRCGGRAG